MLLETVWQEHLLQRVLEAPGMFGVEVVTFARKYVPNCRVRERLLRLRIHGRLRTIQDRSLNARIFALVVLPCHHRRCHGPPLSTGEQRLRTTLRAAVLAWMLSSIGIDLCCDLLLMVRQAGCRHP